MCSFKRIDDVFPLPVMAIDKEGKIFASNSLIGEVFIYDEIEGADIFAMTRLKYEDFKVAIDENKDLSIERNEKVFKITPKIVSNESIYLFFEDITELVNVRNKYDGEKTCIAILNIDNYDELRTDSYTDGNMVLITEIDKVIRKWGEKLEASVTRHKENLYCIVFSKGKCLEEMQEKFQILDEIREIDSDRDFPITLSIGIGINGKNPEESDEHAQQALDLALGRGGDQVVVKDGDSLSYFGGKAQAVEKSNKGKSRIIAHALKELVRSSSKVMIMGHKNPDMDAFGAAMGISRAATKYNKETYIILEDYSEALDLLYTEAVKTDEYNIISRKKAMELVDDMSLVIVVDTHKPSITECPELLEMNIRKVVIDHHRKGEEFIENPTLVYMEPYASSTSELVTEILQYLMDRKDISRLEAEGLLAGIFVDTNKFTTQTGVRTFEAAAWLRRAGADLLNVKKLFQVDKALFMDRIYGISNAEFTDSGIVYTICRGESPNSQIICSLVADELLTIRGVKTTFAIGTNHRGRTVISARSIGEKNVQVIMEKFGGGGHINAAGAQTDMTPLEVITRLKEIMEEEK